MTDKPGDGASVPAVSHAVDQQRHASDRAWIVGVDGSPVSDDVLCWAARQAVGRASQLRLVTAWQTALHGSAVGADVESQEAHDIASESLAAMQRYLTEIAGTRTGLGVDAQVVLGGASAVLLDAAEDGSLLIVGNRGRGTLARLISGSTSNQCTVHAVVPTVVVPAHRLMAGSSVRVDRIVVGLDGSPNSVAGLRWAADFATRGSTVQAVTVRDTTVSSSEDREAPKLRAIVDGVAAAAGARGIDVEHRFCYGVPRDTLITVAESAGLLVVGKRGAGAIGARLLGSVSESVVRRVRVPTVVVPDEDRSAVKHSALCSGGKLS